MAIRILYNSFSEYSFINSISLIFSDRSKQLSIFAFTHKRCVAHQHLQKKNVLYSTLVESLLFHNYNSLLLHQCFSCKVSCQADLTLRYGYKVPCLSIIYCLYPLIKNLGKFLDIHLIHLFSCSWVKAHAI